MILNKIKLPQHYNYIGVFLSLSCNLSCSYCINHLVGLNKTRRLLNDQDWINGLNRIVSPQSIPISIQGGEPSIHRDFYKIINGINEKTSLDILTNIQFDPSVFIKKISNKRFSRDLPYPAIRVSYHPETMDLKKTIEKVKILHDNGYSIGIFSVDIPKYKKEIFIAKEMCTKNDLIFKTKEFLGMYDGKLYGTYKYPESVFSNTQKECLCKTSELLICPEGFVYRCHHDLYNKINPIGDLLDNNFTIMDEFKPCSYFGKCNPCDVKLKNNRLQEFGHCSVEIKQLLD
ncbi:MAG: radical SAM protein [Halobacteriovoraceae bacterium]|jgi:sulfatase maturation enzyme AslB (radical SAM superfamily)|nr:radical SAM protein [Halobacteriovoraceae bacterium]